MVKNLTSGFRTGFKVPPPKYDLKYPFPKNKKKMFSRTYIRNVPGKTRVQGGAKV